MAQRKLIAFTVLILSLFTWSGYKLYLQQETAHTATGTVEVTKTDITAKAGGYLAELAIKEGDSVTARQRVAQLDRRDLSAQLTRDTAALEKANAQLADLYKGARPEELRAAAANVASAVSVYQKSHADYLRYQELYLNHAIAEQQLDTAKSADAVAQNALISAREAENLLLAGNRSDVIQAQELEVKRAEAVLHSTQIADEDNTLYSPIAGLVLSKNYEPGEYVATGSAIATIADLSDCWIKIYVPSDELGTIQIGQPAQVKIDAFPNRAFAGTIKEISDTAEFTPRQSITKNERANMVFAVKVAVANDDGILKPGMPADVILK